MQKEIRCNKPGHDMVLDALCLNAECASKGLFCHKCFIENPHNHLGTDIMDFKLFSSESQTAFENIEINLLSEKDSDLELAREKYSASKKILSACRAKTLDIVNEPFQRLEDDMNEDFGYITKNFEDTKAKALREMEDCTQLLSAVKGNSTDDHQAISEKLLNLAGIFKITETNNFTLKQSAGLEPKEGSEKSKKLKKFKEKDRNMKEYVRDVYKWLKELPIEEELPELKKEIQIDTRNAIEQLSSELAVKPTEDVLGKRQILSTVNIDIKEQSCSQPQKKLKVNLEDEREGESEREKANDRVKERDKGREKTKQRETLPEYTTNSRNSKSVQANKKLVLDERQKKEIKQMEKYLATDEGVKKPMSVIRFAIDNDHYERFKSSDIFAVTLSTDWDLTLIGFGQYTIVNPVSTINFDYAVIHGESTDSSRMINMSSRVLCTGSFKITRDENLNKIKRVLFENPVNLQKSRFYTLQIKVRPVNDEFLCYKGINGIDKVTPFCFYMTQRDNMKKAKNNVTKGQIPELLYRC